MKKGIRQLFALNIMKKNFSTNLKLNMKTTTKGSLDSEVEYKPFYFKHQSIEYRAQIPAKANQTLKEFLDNFSIEHSTDKKKYSYKDFEVSRGQKYLNFHQNLNDLKTLPNDKDPVIFLDSTLTLSNLKYRGLLHLTNPYDTSSQALQTFLNSFLDKIQGNMNKINKESIISNFKSFSSLEGNKSKTDLCIIAIFNQLQDVFEDKNLKLEFIINNEVDMTDFNKNNIKDIFIVKNVNNGVHIPVNVISPTSDENQRIKSFDEAIINNMDTLRKLALKNNTTLNFGVITDFHNWKFNLYHKPTDKSVEKPSDYSTSLKYTLSASYSEIHNHSFGLILRVLAGLFTVDQKEVAKRRSI